MNLVEVEGAHCLEGGKSAGGVDGQLLVELAQLLQDHDLSQGPCLSLESAVCGLDSSHLARAPEH